MKRIILLLVLSGLVSFFTVESIAGDIVVKFRTGDLKITDPTGYIHIIKTGDKVPEILFNSILEALSGEFIITVGTTHKIFLKRGQIAQIFQTSKKNPGIKSLIGTIMGEIQTAQFNPTTGSTEVVTQGVTFTPPTIGPPSEPGTINFPISPEQAASPYMP